MQAFADDGESTVAVRVTDDLESMIETNFDHHCERPSRIADVVVTSPIDESQSVTLIGNIYDPGLADTFTLTVNWGDGQSVFPYAAGTTSFSETHLYDDNDPPGTTVDYTVSLTLTDDDGGQHEESLNVTVGNVLPDFGLVGRATWRREAPIR